MIARRDGQVHGDSFPPEVQCQAVQRRILAWFSVHGRDLPWRRTLDPYAILVSEVMLQQTQVGRVVPRYEAFLERFPALSSLAAADTPELLRSWSGLGYNNRALRLRQAARIVEREHDGRLPDREASLLALPGVGRYTARALLVFGWNRPVAAVDTNVRRVLIHELGLDPGITDRELDGVATHMVPAGRAREWHHALMDYGASVLSSRATGIRSRSRQSAFEGSRRQVRGAILRVLLDRASPLSPAALASILDMEETRVAEAVAALQRDGLLGSLPSGEVALGEAHP